MGCRLLSGSSLLRLMRATLGILEYLWEPENGWLRKSRDLEERERESERKCKNPEMADIFSQSRFVFQVSELTADLAEEHTLATHASEMLEAESSERMKLEKELQDIQVTFF